MDGNYSDRVLYIRIYIYIYMPLVGMPKKSVGHIPRFDHSTCETKNHSPFFLSCQRKMVKRRCDAAVWDTTYTVVGDSWNFPFDRIVPCITLYNPYHKFILYRNHCVDQDCALIEIQSWPAPFIDSLRRQATGSQTPATPPFAASGPEMTTRISRQSQQKRTQRDSMSQRHPNG